MLMIIRRWYIQRNWYRWFKSKNNAITASNKIINFVDNKLTTTGLAVIGNIKVNGIGTFGTEVDINNIKIKESSITSSGKQLDFSDNKLTTTGLAVLGNVNVSSGVGTFKETDVGNLNFKNSSITTDTSDGIISFSRNQLKTTGIGSFGNITVNNSGTFGTKTEIANMTIENSKITADNSKLIS